MLKHVADEGKTTSGGFYVVYANIWDKGLAKKEKYFSRVSSQSGRQRLQQKPFRGWENTTLKQDVGKQVWGC